MPDDILSDVEIIHAAYAEKVKDAFTAFADSLSTGQQERACRERFLRAIELVKKSRDLAIVALSDLQAGGAEAQPAAAASQPTTEALSAEDQELVDSVLRGTTGAPRAAPPPTRFGRS